MLIEFPWPLPTWSNATIMVSYFSHHRFQCLSVFSAFMVQNRTHHSSNLIIHSHWWSYFGWLWLELRYHMPQNIYVLHRRTSFWVFSVFYLSLGGSGAAWFATENPRNAQNTKISGGAHVCAHRSKTTRCQFCPVSHCQPYSLRGQRRRRHRFDFRAQIKKNYNSLPKAFASVCLACARFLCGCMCVCGICTGRNFSNHMLDEKSCGSIFGEGEDRE